MRHFALTFSLPLILLGCGGGPPPQPRGEAIGPYQIHCYPSPEAAREALKPLSTELRCDYDRSHDCWTCEL